MSPCSKFPGDTALIGSMRLLVLSVAANAAEDAVELALVKKVCWCVLRNCAMSFSELQYSDFQSSLAARYYLLQPSKLERKLLGEDLLKRRVAAVRKARLPLGPWDPWAAGIEGSNKEKFFWIIVESPFTRA